jgi:hypothetical protein
VTTRELDLARRPGPNHQSQKKKKNNKTKIQQAFARNHRIELPLMISLFSCLRKESKKNIQPLAE